MYGMELTDVFNKYFRKVAETLINKQGVHILNIPEVKCKVNNTNFMYLYTVTENEIYFTIPKLKNKMSSELDSILNTLIKK